MANVYGKFLPDGTYDPSTTPEEIEAAKTAEEARRATQYQRDHKAYIVSLADWQASDDPDKGAPPQPPVKPRPIPR